MQTTRFCGMSENLFVCWYDNHMSGNLLDKLYRRIHHSLSALGGCIVWINLDGVLDWKVGCCLGLKGFWGNIIEQFYTIVSALNDFATVDDSTWYSDLTEHRFCRTRDSCIEQATISGINCLVALEWEAWRDEYAAFDGEPPVLWRAFLRPYQYAESEKDDTFHRLISIRSWPLKARRLKCK